MYICVCVFVHARAFFWLIRGKRKRVLWQFVSYIKIQSYFVNIPLCKHLLIWIYEDRYTYICFKASEIWNLREVKKQPAISMGSTYRWPLTGQPCGPKYFHPLFPLWCFMTTLVTLIPKFFRVFFFPIWPGWRRYYTIKP